jgi:hypothetical protein
MMVAESLLLQTRGDGWDIWIGLAIVAVSIFGSIAQKAIQKFGGKKGEETSDSSSGVPPVASPPPWQPARRPSSAPPARPMPGAPPAAPLRPTATLQPRPTPVARPAAPRTPAPPAAPKPDWQPPRPAPRPRPTPAPPPQTVPEILGRVAGSIKAKIEQIEDQLHGETAGARPKKPKAPKRSTASAEQRPTPRPKADVPAASAFSEEATPPVESAASYAAELRHGGAMALRKAIIYSEILGPPVALRE